MNPPGQILGRGGSKGLLDLWNHVATSYDEDFVADVDAKAVHLSHVVERGVLDGHAAHALGCDAGHGRDVPGSSGLPFNVHEDRIRLLRRELPCQRPPRVMSRHAQALTLFQVIELEHHPVNFVGVPASLLRPSCRGLVEQGGGLRWRGCGVDFPGGWYDAKGVLQPHQHVGIVVHVRNGGAVRVAMLKRGNFRIVGLKHQVGGVGFSIRMLLPKGACRQVPRVRRCLTVFRIKHGQRHHDFPSDVNVHGNRKGVRNVGNFTGIPGDVFPALTAASGGSSNQTAHAVFKRKGRAVQFGLRKELQRPRGGDVHEMVQFLGGRGFVEAAHGKQVVHLHAPRSNVCTNATELWVFGVQLFELVPQTVEFQIAQFGLSEVVVQVGMMSDLLGEEGDTSLSGVGG